MDRKRHDTPKKIIVILCASMVLFGFFWYENHHLVVTTYTYQNEKLDDNLAGYRIVQISDLHNATFGKDNTKLLKKISDLQPNMIVITGDLVDSNHTDIRASIDFVKQAVSCLMTRRLLQGFVNIQWHCGRLSKFENKVEVFDHIGARQHEQAELNNCNLTKNPLY